MSLRHNLILLLTSVCGALALIGSSFAPAQLPGLRPVVSAAPPLNAGMTSTDKPVADDSALAVLRQQANGALSHLQGRGSFGR